MGFKIGGRFRFRGFGSRYPFARKISELRRRHRPIRDESWGDESESMVEPEWLEYGISKHRVPVFWGGHFRGDSPSRYDSPKGFKVRTLYAKLPKLRFCGDDMHKPEIVVICGLHGARRRLGKNVLASHFIKNYSMQRGNVHMPVVVLSKGDEVGLRDGIDLEKEGRRIEEWKKKWVNQGTGQTEYYPVRHPNVTVFGLPHQSPEVLAECDRKFYVNPVDMTSWLFLSMTMLGGGTTTGKPKYMNLAPEIERLIRDDGSSKEECLEYVKKWIDDHPDSADKKAGFKLKGAINDLYGGSHKEGVLRMDAPTLKELIVARRYGEPYIYVFNLKNYDDSSKHFGNHIISNLGRVNNENVEMMKSRRYIPPALIVDEAPQFIPHIGAPDDIPLLEHIQAYGFCSGPVVIITQDRLAIHKTIIDSNYNGLWTHLFELEENYWAAYTCNIQTADSVVIQSQGRYEVRSRESLSVEERRRYKPENYNITAMVKPPEMYIPT